MKPFSKKELSERRQRNLRELLMRFCLGLKDYEVAEKLGIKLARFSLLKNGHRAITDKTARIIEAKFGLGSGWMDREHVIDGINDPNSSTLIENAMDEAMSVIHSFNHTFTPEEQHKIVKAAVEASLNRPLTRNQIKIMIEVFVINHKNHLASLPSPPGEDDEEE